MAYLLPSSPCIPVIRANDGQADLVSLRDALVDAHQFTALDTPLPSQVPAYLRRLLLPVLADALGLPATRTAWRDRFRARRFSPDDIAHIDAYLDTHASRFDLFGDEPFDQVGGLRTEKGDTKGSALLVPTAATGNNVPIFASRSEADALVLRPAEALGWLLYTQCWDTAAIKTGAVGDPNAKAGKTTGNPTGPLGQLGVVVPTGRTLFETLMLNLPIASADVLGTPHWRRPPPDASWTTRHADGLLDLWTWQARRIRLIPEESADGLAVTQVLVCAGDRLASVPETEPHTAWNLQKDTKKATTATWRPRRHVPGKAIWRGLGALLTLERDDTKTYTTSNLLAQLGDLREAGHLEDTYPLTVETFGAVYGNQSAVIEDLLHDAMPMPMAALHTDADAYQLLLDVSQQAEDLARAVNRLGDDLRRATGGEAIPWDKGHRPGEILLHTLDPLVRRLLAGIQAAGGADTDVLNRGHLAWEELAHRAARDVADGLLAATPPSAFTGRELEISKKKMTFRPATAERDFGRQLARILPRAADARAARASTNGTGETDAA